MPIKIDVSTLFYCDFFGDIFPTVQSFKAENFKILLKGKSKLALDKSLLLIIQEHELLNGKQNGMKNLVYARLTFKLPLRSVLIHIFFINIEWLCLLDQKMHGMGGWPKL